ncbi:hypothetical protein CEXT_411651 [Caerostris extrusa]|uniref:Uncharacterized protein n=1 Tax=Caerostris extrusa TaxID=172846 RepID=A0AAV4MB27_CAEEX|nr:hypothetical protein CEXT_411651 [Caerostris extrusa]
MAHLLKNQLNRSIHVSDESSSRFFVLPVQKAFYRSPPLFCPAGMDNGEVQRNNGHLDRIMNLELLPLDHH